MRQRARIAALACAAALALLSASPAADARPTQRPIVTEKDKQQEREFRRGFEAYQRGNFDQAAEIWSTLADEGHIKSMNNLGTMYSHGKGVGRNYSLAMLWYRRSAALGDARAMYNIGIAHEYGRGVATSDARAVEWYRKAADRGLVEAMIALGWVLSTSPDIAVRDGALAKRWVNAALRRKTSSKNLAALAAAHAELGEYRDAVVAIERAIDYLRRETNGADMLTSERELFGLLRQQGRTDDLFDLLERREFYANGQPTRD
ncbi:MAG: sel1 repeat family protein [Alphaproteobacteria bacterium]|nr:sel1 repeat family protein [Alphaproteobacteria bacterium]